MKIYRLYQRKSLFLILIIPGIFLTCPPARAQHTNQELRLNIYQTDDTNRQIQKGVFNATSIGFEYQHRLADHLNGVVGILFSQSIETKGNYSKSAKVKLQQYSISFITLDAGISLIPVTIANDHFEIRISPGISLSHRNSVEPRAALKLKNAPSYTLSLYHSQLKIGAFFNVGFDYIFTSNWLIELRGQYHKYRRIDGIFDIGLSFGRKF